ncbi:hypothetical protein NN6n1_31090 [Shinella zoogloeoides]
MRRLGAKIVEAAHERIPDIGKADPPDCRMGDHLAGAGHDMKARHDTPPCRLETVNGARKRRAIVRHHGRP